MNPHDLDNEALAFKPVLGSMLARIYHNPHNKEENQSRLQKILQFWGTKEVYDQETIHAFETEMLGGPPAFPVPGPPKELLGSPFDVSAVGKICVPSVYPPDNWASCKSTYIHSFSFYRVAKHSSSTIAAR